MANEVPITVTGNLTTDPETRFTASGAAVTTFKLASTPRSWDKQAGAWKEGETLFLRCQCWRQQGENAGESLAQGQRVIVQGRLVQRSFDTKDGEKRTVVEVVVDEVGPSLRYATATVQKNPARTPNDDGNRPSASASSTVFNHDPPF